MEKTALLRWMQCDSRSCHKSVNQSYCAQVWVCVGLIAALLMAKMKWFLGCSTSGK